MYFCLFGKIKSISSFQLYIFCYYLFSVIISQKNEHNCFKFSGYNQKKKKTNIENKMKSRKLGEKTFKFIISSFCCSCCLCGCHFVYLIYSLACRYGLLLFHISPSFSLLSLSLSTILLSSKLSSYQLWEVKKMYNNIIGRKH